MDGEELSELRVYGNGSVIKLTSKKKNEEECCRENNDKYVIKKLSGMQIRENKRKVKKYTLKKKIRMARMVRCKIE